MEKQKEYITSLCMKIYQIKPKTIKLLDSLSNFVFFVELENGKKQIFKLLTETENIFLFDKNNYEKLILKIHFFQDLIYKKGDDYIIENYIENKSVSIKETSDQDIQILLIKRIAQFHQQFPTSNKDNLIITKTWNKIEKQLYNAININFKVQDRKNKVLKVMNHVKSFIENDINQMDLKELNFCHHDILNGNILFNLKNNQYTFIDFEYSGYNHFLGDIYNLVIESTYEYSDNYEKGFNQNLSVFPNLQRIKELIRYYLFFKTFGKEYFEQEDLVENLKDVKQDKRLQDIDEKKIEEFSKIFYFVGTFINIYWCIWAFYIFNKEGINFDYVQFGFSRYEDFLRDLKNLQKLN